MIKNGSVDCETELTVDIHRNLIYCNNTEVRQTACNDLDDCAARLEVMMQYLFSRPKHATTVKQLLL